MLLVHNLKILVKTTTNSVGCTLEFVIPIGAVFVYDLFEDRLQYFVRGFCQSIRLRVVRRTFLMYYRVVRGELTDNVI